MEQKWSLIQLPRPTSSHQNQIFLLFYASLTLLPLFFLFSTTSRTDRKQNSSWQVEQIDTIYDFTDLQFLSNTYLEMLEKDPGEGVPEV